MQLSSLLVTVVLPLLLSFAGYVAYQHVTHPFPAITMKLSPPPSLPQPDSNSLLQSASLHSSPLLQAPEHIAFHPSDHSLWTGCYDGSIVRIAFPAASDSSPSLPTFTTVSYTGFAASLLPNATAGCKGGGNHWLCGRPLGLDWRNDKELLIADGYHGLLLLDTVHSQYTSLWNDSGCDTNSVLLAANGDDVFFTSASCLYRNYQVMYDALSGQCTGSVWHYSFSSGTARRLLHGLCFPNGLLLADEGEPQRRSLIIAETNVAAIHSLQLSSLTHRVVASNLPCLPDNLHWDKQSTSHYWAGCGGPVRIAEAFSLYDFAAPWPVLRQLMAYSLPYWLLRQFVKREAMIVRMRIEQPQQRHAVSDVMQDPQGLRVRTTTSAHWRAEDDRLWLTSYLPHIDYVASVAWKPPPLSAADHTQNTD